MIHQEHYYNLPALLYVLSNALSFSNKIVLPFLPGTLGSSLSNDPECRRIAGGAGGANMLQVLLTDDDDDRLRDFRWDIFRVTCSNSRVKDSRIPLSFPWSFSVKLRSFGSWHNLACAATSLLQKWQRAFTKSLLRSIIRVQKC